MYVYICVRVYMYIYIHIYICVCASPECQLFIDIFSAFKKSDPLAALGAIGVVNIEKLSKWFHESRMDPNDPANADLLYLIGVR